MARKRLKVPALKLFVKDGDSSKEITEEQLFSGTHPEVYAKVNNSNLQPAQTPKITVHSITSTHILSEYYNNGKKSHSSEIEFSVAESLITAQAKNEREEQAAEDDNNFWKNPVNQTAQVTFNEDATKAKPKYGGHITLEEVVRYLNKARQAQNS